MRREERHGIHAAGITTRRGCKQLLGLRGAHLLQVGKTGGIHHLPPERFERRGILVGSNEAPHAAAALDYGTSDHIARQRRCDQILDARRAGALPHKRYVVGVAAEGRYIAPDPPQSSYLVESAVVARAAVAALGVRQKASRAQTVVERYQNYIPPRPLLAVHRDLVSVAVDVCSAVDPYGHGQLAAGIAHGIGRRPYIEIEAILVHPGIVAEIELTLVEGALLVAGLPRYVGKSVGLEHTLPRLDGLRRAPPQIAHGRCGVRYAPEDGDIARRRKTPPDLAVGDFGRRQCRPAGAGTCEQQCREKSCATYHDDYIFIKGKVFRPNGKTDGRPSRQSHKKRRPARGVARSIARHAPIRSSEQHRSKRR